MSESVTGTNPIDRAPKPTFDISVEVWEVKVNEAKALADQIRASLPDIKRVVKQATETKSGDDLRTAMAVFNKYGAMALQFEQMVEKFPGKYDFENAMVMDGQKGYDIMDAPATNEIGEDLIDKMDIMRSGGADHYLLARIDQLGEDLVRPFVTASGEGVIDYDNYTYEVSIFDYTNQELIDGTIDYCDGDEAKAYALIEEAVTMQRELGLLS